MTALALIAHRSGMATPTDIATVMGIEALVILGVLSVCTVMGRE